MSQWLQSAQASVAAGSLTVIFTDGVDVSSVKLGDAILINGNIWQCRSGTKPDNLGNSTLILATAWPYATASNVAANVFRTTHDLLRLTADARKLTDITKSLLLTQEEILKSDLESLSIPVGIDPATGEEEVIKVTPWQYIVNQAKVPEYALTKRQFEINCDHNKDLYAGSGVISAKPAPIGVNAIIGNSVEYGLYELKPLQPYKLGITEHVFNVAGIRINMPAQTIQTQLASNTADKLETKDLLYLAVTKHESVTLSEAVLMSNTFYWDGSKFIYFVADYLSAEVNTSDVFAAFTKLGFSRISGDRGYLFAKDNIQALPISFVQHMNQGAFSGEFNPFGCAYKGTAGWLVNNRPTSRIDCFINHVGGAIGQSSGRPTDDIYPFFDAIYAGQIRDIRLSAIKLDANTLNELSMQRAVVGKTRGIGKLPCICGIASNIAAVGGYINAGIWYFTNPFSGIKKRMISAPAQAGDLDCLNWIFIRKGDNKFCKLFAWGNQFHCKLRWLNGSTWQDLAAAEIIGYEFIAINYAVSDNMSDDLIYNSGASNGAWGFYYHNVLSDAVYIDTCFDELPWLDVIASPLSVALAFPHGLLGQLIADAPDGGGKVHYANRKISAAGQLLVSSNDSWIQASTSGNSVNNSITASYSRNEIRLCSYMSLADFSIKSDNIAVIGTPQKVYASMNSAITRGNRLQPTLTTQIGRSTGSTARHSGYVFLQESSDSEGILTNNHGYYPRHNPLNIAAADNSSPAFKVLYSTIEKDGLLYMQYHGVELKWKNGVVNGWGDTVPSTDYALPYGTVPLTNGTLTDRNGNIVKTFCHHELIPLGIASDNQTSLQTTRTFRLWVDRVEKPLIGNINYHH